MSQLSRFLGGRPAAVAVKLIIISLIVGGIMTAMGWTPMDIVDSVLSFFTGLWNLGFGAIEQFGQYLIAGAVIVVPVFLLMRLLSYRR